MMSICDWAGAGCTGNDGWESIPGTPPRDDSLEIGEGIESSAWDVRGYPSVCVLNGQRRRSCKIAE